jgi:hypothetical protein
MTNEGIPVTPKEKVSPEEELEQLENLHRPRKKKETEDVGKSEKEKQREGLQVRLAESEQELQRDEEELRKSEIFASQLNTDIEELDREIEKAELVLKGGELGKKYENALNMLRKALWAKSEMIGKSRDEVLAKAREMPDTKGLFKRPNEEKQTLLSEAVRLKSEIDILDDTYNKAISFRAYRLLGKYSNWSTFDIDSKPLLSNLEHLSLDDEAHLRYQEALLAFHEVLQKLNLEGLDPLEAYRLSTAIGGDGGSNSTEVRMKEVSDGVERLREEKRRKESDKKWSVGDVEARRKKVEGTKHKVTAIQEEIVVIGQ